MLSATQRLRLFHGIRSQWLSHKLCPWGCLALCSCCLPLSSQTPTPGCSRITFSQCHRSPARSSKAHSGPPVFLLDRLLRPVSEPLLPGSPLGLPPACMRLAHPPFHIVTSCRSRICSCWSISVFKAVWVMGLKSICADMGYRGP